MNEYSIFNIKKILTSIRHPLRGLKVAFLTEVSLRQEMLLFAILTPLAFIFAHNAAGRSLLIGSLLLVIIMELINTAIETIVDRIGVEHHHLSGKAKDIGSAAVLVAGLNALIIWLLFIVEFLT